MSAVFDIGPGADIKQTFEALGTAIRMLLADGPVRVEVENVKERRSTSANALYWQWLTVMAKHFSRKGQVFTKDDMHDLMRHKFLGYEERKVGNTALQPQLKSTADLDTAKMCEYMTKLDAWCADHGCLLPRPEDNDYAQWQKAAA